MTNSLIVEVIQIQYLLRGKFDRSITFLFHLFLDTTTQSNGTIEVLHFILFIYLFLDTATQSNGTIEEKMTFFSC